MPNEAIILHNVELITKHKTTTRHTWTSSLITWYSCPITSSTILATIFGRWSFSPHSFLKSNATGFRTGFPSTPRGPLTIHWLFDLKENRNDFWNFYLCQILFQKKDQILNALFESLLKLCVLTRIGLFPNFPSIFSRKYNTSCISQMTPSRGPMVIVIPDCKCTTTHRIIDMTTIRQLVSLAFTLAFFKRTSWPAITFTGKISCVDRYTRTFFTRIHS